MDRAARPILLATDLSPGWAPLFTIAASLARSGAPVIGLHVYSPDDYADAQRETGLPIDQYVAGLRAEMRFQAEQAGLAPGTIQYEIVEGWSVPEEILEAARRTRPAMIVMGTHGRTGLRRALLGSVAEEVLRRAPVPVLIVSATALAALAGEAVRAA
jgi:nucleotide-binding universal stress UspA family protein